MIISGRRHFCFSDAFYFSNGVGSYDLAALDKAQTSQADVSNSVQVTPKLSRLMKST